MSSFRQRLNQYQPIGDEKQQELHRLALAGDSDACEHLLISILPFVHGQVRYWLRGLGRTQHIDAVYDAAYDAILRWRPEEGKLTTLATWTVRRIAMERKREQHRSMPFSAMRRRVGPLPLDVDQLLHDKKPQQPNHAAEQRYFEELLDALSPRDRRALEGWLAGKNLRDLVGSMKLNRESIRQSLRRAQQQLLELSQQFPFDAERYAVATTTDEPAEKPAEPQCSSLPGTAARRWSVARGLLWARAARYVGLHGPQTLQQMREQFPGRNLQGVLYRRDLFRPCRETGQFSLLPDVAAEIAQLEQAEGKSA